MRESPIEQEENKVQFDLFFYDEADNQICLVWLCKSFKVKLYYSESDC